MKKIIITLAAVAMTMSAAIAQNYQKNIVGVNAGLNVSSVSGDVFYGFKSKAGFHVGASYERLLMNDKPLYLETGLQYSLKGCRYTDYEEKDNYNTSYFEIPVMVNYKFHLTDDFTLYPSLGIYYAIGLGGHEVWKYDGETEKYPLFGKVGMFKRSDLGLRVAASVGFKKFTLSLGYELGFMNVLKSEGGYDYDWDDYSLTRASYDYDDDYGYKANAHSGNFFISVGYKF